MAGLVPAIHVLLRDGLKEILPFRIGRDNQPNFPGAGPMLDIVFALDRVLDRCELLEVNQGLQSVLFREAFDETRAMLEDPADKIVCHADIKDAIRPISHEVDVAAAMR